MSTTPSDMQSVNGVGRYYGHCFGLNTFPFRKKKWMQNVPSFIYTGYSGPFPVYNYKSVYGQWDPSQLRLYPRSQSPTAEIHIDNYKAD